MNTTRVLLFTGFVFLLVTATGTAGVAAQEIDLDIEFEEPVKAGEETTITHVATAVEASVEVDAEVELTLLVDGEEIRTRTFEETVVEGETRRTNFTHTFDTPGEKGVTFEGTISALGQELSDSVTRTVMVYRENATVVEVTPETPGVVEVNSTGSGVGVGNVTVRASQETTAVVEFDDGEPEQELPANSLRTVRLGVDGDGVENFSLGYEAEANVSVHRLDGGEWTREGVSVESEGNASTATVEEPPYPIYLTFVDEDAEETEEPEGEPDEEGGDEEGGEGEGDDDGGGEEGLPGFGFLATFVALLGGGSLVRLRSDT